MRTKKYFSLLLAFVAVGLNAFSIEQEDGVYRIGSRADMEEFATMVNEGQTTISAKLTADVDMSGSQTMIGTSTNVYAGSFDGQNHTINVTYNTGTDGMALFLYSSGNISNLNVTGTITTSVARAAGFVANSKGGSIINSVSYVNIVSDVDGEGDHGGLIGHKYGNNKLTIQNCAFYGSIKGDKTTCCGGLTGWNEGNSSTTFVENCVVDADFDLAQADRKDNWHEALFVRNYNSYTMTNCYYTNTYGKVASQAVQVSREKVESGELCYMLNKNSDAPETVWRQKIGADQHPVIGGEDIVHCVGHSHCNGDSYEDICFTNENGSLIQDEHNYVDGMCTYCHALKIGEDGYINIGTADMLAAFANQVNTGEVGLNARLTADIDFSECQNMIGTDANRYAGIFDGQYHSITVGYNGTGAAAALFAYTKDGAVIKNLHTTGDIQTDGLRASGVIANCYGAQLDKITSDVAITSTHEGEGNHAGMIGQAYSGTVTISNCGFFGSISGEKTTCCGGLTGWNNGAALTVENCVVDGYFAISPAEAVNNWNSATFCRNYNSYTMRNCYYTRPNGNVAWQAKQILDDEVVNGALCYMLNNNTFVDANWFQTLNEDEKPVVDPSHGLVYQISKDEYGYSDGKDENSILREDVVNYELTKCQETVATASLLEEYRIMLEELAQTADFDSFVEAYKQLAPMQAKIAESEASYVKYDNEVQSIIDYCNSHYDELAGLALEKLECYLYEIIEPGEDFPNGTYDYILDYHLLTTEEIQAEIAFVNGLLDEVKRSSYNAGDDITSLLAGSILDSNYKSVEDIFDQHHTLTKMRNGYYLLEWNGLFCPGTDINSNNYGALMYMNETAVPVMVMTEEEVDDEPNQGVLTAAFAEGKYKNMLIAKATDNELTIGIKNVGTPQFTSDTTIRGGLRLTYLGDDISEHVSDVLASMSARANTLFDPTEDCPNFDQSIKDDLKELMDKGSNTFESISLYSTLFQNAIDCRKAYYDLYIDYCNLYDAYYNVEDFNENVIAEMDIAVMKLEEGEVPFKDALAKTPLYELIAYNMYKDVIPPFTDGWYMIDSADKLEWYAERVNNYSYSAVEVLNAKLTADIDYSQKTSMIGASDNGFSATFDGQFHKVKVGFDRTEDAAALFAYVKNGTIRNVHTTGTITTSSTKASGLVANCYGATIDGCISDVDIVSTTVGEGNHAGFVGQVFSTPFNLTNCAFYGSIKGENTRCCGGLTGWMSAWGYIGNCVVAAVMEIDPNEVVNNWTSATFCRNYNNYGMNNCYYLNSLGNVAWQGVQITKEQIANGELCYLLNGNQSNIRWYQTIGKDAYPVLDPSHLQVFKDGDRYYNKTDNEDAIINIASDTKQGIGSRYTGVYDLTGRRVAKDADHLSQLPGGIYIIGGKKMVIQ